MINKKYKVALIENNEMGIKTYNYDLVKALAEKYETAVLTEITGVFDIGDLKKKVKFINVGKSVLNPFTALLYLIRLHRALKKIKPDVCLTFTIRPNIYGNIITRILKIPTITSITGIGPLLESKSLTYAIARKLYKWTLKKSTAVFFPNADDLELFIKRKYVTKSQAHIVPGSGVNIDHFSPVLMPQKKNSVFIFLFIGRLLKDKGVIEFVEAASGLKQKMPSVECHIIGPLWDSNKKSLSVSESDIRVWEENEWIIYHGSQNDVRPFIANADCVVLPSYREGLNNVLLEAASMGQPIITTNVTGCKEVVDDGKNGLLCKPGDSNDLAQKMLQMAGYPLEKRKEMGKLGREKIIKEYDKKIVINEYLTKIDGIISENKV